MPTVLEELKMRQAAAQTRQALAQQRWQAAQAEINAANTEVAIWTNAVNIETRDEALRVAAATQDQLAMDLPSGEPTEASVAANSEAEPISDHEDETTINKTELVRELLRQNPGGMTPATLWSRFHEQAPKASRGYLYSVLKRLRDGEYVAQRRGKYVLKGKPATDAVTEDERFEGGVAVN